MPALDFSRFYKYDELIPILKAFAAERPDLVAYGEIGRSHEGRAIPLLTITRFAKGAPEDKPAYWVDGNIHSIELSASSACLYFVHWLLTNDGQDANVTRQLDTRTLYVAPRLNPDAPSGRWLTGRSTCAHRHAAIRTTRSPPRACWSRTSTATAASCRCACAIRMARGRSTRSSPR